MHASTTQPRVPRSRFGAARLSGGRRLAFVLVALTMALSAVGGAVLPTPRAAFAAETMTTVGDTPLFAGPDGSYDILTTVPAGSSVTIDGDMDSGFWPVTVDGISGWVADGTLSAGGSQARAGEGSTDGTGNTTKNGKGGKKAAAAPSGGDGTAAGGDPVYGAEPADYPAYDGSLAIPQGQSTSAGSSSQWSEDQVVGFITDAANAYNQSPDDMVRVARCESGLNPYAVGSGIYYGLFQFVPSTFAGTPYGDGDIFDPAANANAAAWMWAQGRKGEWSCQ